MIVKLAKIISCSSEDPAYPAANLLRQRTDSSWRCAKPGELLASVIIELRESACITGMDIGNYRSCIVVVTASTSAEPDNWIPIINHQFMSHDEAANGKFRDQVQLFTKKELNAETIKIKFDRVKVTCMQSANLRENFGLAFIVVRTEVVVDLGVDVFARFKLNNNANGVEDLKDKYAKLLPKRKVGYKEELADKIKEASATKFARKQQEDARSVEPTTSSADKERSIVTATPLDVDVAKEVDLQKKRDEKKTSDDQRPKTPVARTPFGDVIVKKDESTKKRTLHRADSSEDEKRRTKERDECTKCSKISPDSLCDKCKKLAPQKAAKVVPTPPRKKAKLVAKPQREFAKLFEDVKFALSGYQNPQRDEIRRKALKMGGKYIADPNTTDNKCTHLICAFQKTPKSQQLRGHAKIVTHKFIVQCFDKRTRLPWRRFALDKKEKEQSESEEEIEASGTASASPSPDPYQQDTDDSDSNY